jgi:hypothetical protein
VIKNLKYENDYLTQQVARLRQSHEATEEVTHTLKTEGDDMIRNIKDKDSIIQS